MEKITTAFPTATPVGYWRATLTEGSTVAPFPMSDTSRLTEAQTAKVVAYLKAPHTRIAYRGWSTCRICGIANGSEDVCDGTYVWPSGLAHYVEAHGVELPLGLIVHIHGGGSEAPTETIRGWLMLRPGQEIGAFGPSALHATEDEARAHALACFDGDAEALAEIGLRPMHVDAQVRAGRVVSAEFSAARIVGAMPLDGDRIQGILVGATVVGRVVGDMVRLDSDPEGRRWYLSAFGDLVVTARRCPAELEEMCAKLDKAAAEHRCPASPTGTWADQWHRIGRHVHELEIWLVHPDRVPDCLRRDLSPADSAMVTMLKDRISELHPVKDERRVRELRTHLLAIRGYE